jgi:hypothetical protein
VVTSSPSVSPSPSASPGSVQVSTETVYWQESSLAALYTATFTLTAVGGPVTYSISVPADEQYLTVSPQQPRTLQAGQQVEITVGTSPLGTSPPYSSTVTVDPGGIVITIYNNDVIQ